MLRARAKLSQYIHHTARTNISRTLNATNFNHTRRTFADSAHTSVVQQVEQKQRGKRKHSKTRRIAIAAGVGATLFFTAQYVSELYHELFEKNNKQLHNEHPDIYHFVQTYVRPTTQVIEGFVRYARTISAAIIVGLDYKYTQIVSGEKYETDEQIRKDLHTRSAERFLQLFKKNGCIYIKVGQYLASLHHVIPEEYCQVLSVLQDKAPSVDYAQVERVILDDMGVPISELFSSFDKEPFAAASLAQVHRATTKDGQEVAVKVQYPLVRFNFEGDMLTQDVVLFLLKFAFPGYDFQFMGPELKQTLRTELDFVTEVKNAKRARDNFKAQGRTDIYIPEVIESCSGSRVMTTELITNSVKISDVAGLARLGLDTAEVARITLEAFAEQIYWHAFVHADPHPGNILIRVNPAWKEDDSHLLYNHSQQSEEIPKTQVVILDHGLYREMSEEFRQSYCRIWKAMVLNDEKELRRQCEEQGIDDYKTYAFLVMMRAYDGATPGMSRNLSKKQVQEALDKLKTQMDSVTQVLKKLHPDMLFILRSQNLLRSINVQLGVPVNRFTIFARKATEGINQEPKQNGIMSRILTLKERFMFEVHLQFFAVMASVMNMYFSMQIFLGLKERMVLPEDEIENHRAG